MTFAPASAAAVAGNDAAKRSTKRLAVFMNLRSFFTASPVKTPWLVLRADSLDEALDEFERGVGNFSPAAVDRKRVSAIGDLDDLCRAAVSQLALEGRVCDHRRNGVVLLSRNDQQGATFWVPCIDLCLGPRIEVGR